MRIIAGPCQHESLGQSAVIAKECKRVCDKYGIEYYFKASYDKANRTSANGKRGVPSVIETRYGKEIFGLFAAVSFDEASTFAIVRLVSDDSRTSHDVQSTDGHIFQMNQTHAEPMGYISAIQDQKSGMIHAITSRQHYQFNYAWLMAGKG